jgi:hypothetical protein
VVWVCGNKERTDERDGPKFRAKPCPYKNPAKDFCYGDLNVRPPSVVVCPCKWQMARWTSPHEQSCYRLILFHLAIQGAATEFRCAGQMHRIRDARAVGCHSLVSRVAIHRVKRDRRTCWRAASSEAFALYVLVAGCGRAPKTFPKRAHKRACSRLVRIM